MIGKLFGLLVIILDIIGIMDVVKSEKPAANKGLWIFVIICLPMVGIILYFLVGKK